MPEDNAISWPALIQSENSLRQSPLHWGCTIENLSVLQFLLREGADIHAIDSKGVTPLIMGTNVTLGVMALSLLVAFQPASTAMCPACRSSLPTGPTCTLPTLRATTRCTGRSTRVRLSLLFVCHTGCPMDAFPFVVSSRRCRMIHRDSVCLLLFDDCS